MNSYERYMAAVQEAPVIYSPVPILMALPQTHRINYGQFAQIIGYWLKLTCGVLRILILIR